MKKYKLKKWVMPTVYTICICLTIISFTTITREAIADLKTNKDLEYVSKYIVEDDTTNVVKVTNETVNHPYLLENVQIAKNFYEGTLSAEEKVKALLFYKNTYMQNTGVLYSSDETFDVISVLDGTVTSITEDDILGTVVEITHTNELITIYSCLKKANVEIGQHVSQNDVIGTSGKVNVDKGYENALLFEVNYKGEILNPIKFYNMQISELMN